jgi:hypothetical protein
MDVNAQIAFMSAVASIDNELTISDISINGAEQKQKIEISTSSMELIVSYNIYVFAQHFGLVTTESVISYFTGALATSINTGNFLTNLKMFGDAYNTTIFNQSTLSTFTLEGTTSTYDTPTPSFAPTEITLSRSSILKKVKSTISSTIVLLAIGVIFFFCCAVLGTNYIWYRKNKREKSTYPATKVDGMPSQINSQHQETDIESNPSPQQQISVLEFNDIEVMTATPPKRKKGGSSKRVLKESFSAEIPRNRYKLYADYYSTKDRNDHMSHDVEITNSPDKMNITHKNRTDSSKKKSKSSKKNSNNKQYETKELGKEIDSPSGTLYDNKTPSSNRNIMTVPYSPMKSPIKSPSKHHSLNKVYADNYSPAKHMKMESA